MLISVRRIATTTISVVRFPPVHGSQSRCVLPLLLYSPLTAGRNSKSVLETLKDHGFTDAQIDILARKSPRIFSSCSGNLVGTKMSYLCQELGLDRSDLVKILTSYPGVLLRSVKNTIIPSLNYLETLLGTRHSVIRTIVRLPWLLCRAHGRVAANVAMLKESGVPDLNIRKLLLTQHWTLVFYKPERFRSLLDYVVSAELDPSASMFIHAILVKSSMSSSTWEKKIRVYLSFGWSAEETQLAFRRCPFLYSYSEERLIQKLDFVTKVLGMRPSEVLMYVNVMTCSLEGTLIPRCCVLNVLMKKGLVKKDLKVHWALCKSKQKFAMLFVEKYRDSAPEVLEAYQGKMQFSGFDRE